jgi:hypothetical protein
MYVDGYGAFTEDKLIPSISRDESNSDLREIFPLGMVGPASPITKHPYKQVRPVSSPVVPRAKHAYINCALFLNSLLNCRRNKKDKHKHICCRKSE